MKLCSACRRELPRTEYHRDASRPDGLEYRCRDCVRSGNRPKHPVPLARRRLTDAERDRLRVLERGVAAFCRACEPDGVCHMARCELRPVSPLPLAVA
jgi:hypothetical protein